MTIPVSLYVDCVDCVDCVPGQNRKCWGQKTKTNE